jgi:hypothetical protein
LQVYLSLSIRHHKQQPCLYISAVTMSLQVPSVYYNPKAAEFEFKGAAPTPLVLEFHKQLPNYAETPLIPLPALATELGIRKVFLKDESTRFGLPSFKILGASWGIYRALIKQCGLAIGVSIDEVGEAARVRNISLVRGSSITSTMRPKAVLDET